MDGGATDVRLTYVHKGQRFASVFNDDKFSVPEQHVYGYDSYLFTNK